MAEENKQLQYLMRQALAGDEKLYEQLLKESSQILRPFLARYLTGQNEAEDVLQEILISVHKARHTYDGLRPYKPWLFAIAKFRLQDHLRRFYANKIRNAIDLTEIENILPAPVTNTPLASELLQESLKELSGRQAEIVELIHGEGYTAKEVGVKLGMKESAVKVAAHRAYKSLRKKFQGKDHDEY